MKKIFLAIVLVAFSYASDLKIAAAANTTYAFEELKAEFAKIYPNAKLEVNLGSSGKLVAQIKNGAPFDIFMSADMGFAQKLKDENFAITDPKIYAKGKVAMFSTRNFVLSKGLEILLDENVKTISIANPKTAPYGKATIQALKNAKLYEKVKSKIVEAGSIGDALNQSLKASDIGFIAASSMYSNKMKDKYKENKNYVYFDGYDPIAQGIVILKNGENNEVAKAFYDFILSEKGKEIFSRYGYEF